jgi:hypothetical protein
MGGHKLGSRQWGTPKNPLAEATTRVELTVAGVQRKTVSPFTGLFKKAQHDLEGPNIISFGYLRDSGVRPKKRLRCLSRRSNTRRRPAATVATPSDSKTCPDCAEEVKSAARVCPFCGHRFAEQG